MSRPRTFNLADLFEIVAGCVPDRTAFRCGEHSLTFRELDESANRFGSALRARGLGRGDHVGIQLYNSVEYLEAFLGCCKVGAVPVNVNYRYVSEELAYLFRTLDFKALVYGVDFETEVAATVPRVPTLKTLLRVGGDGRAVAVEDFAAVIASGSRELEDPGRSDDDIYMLCTGGTTGMPKGVMWPHKAIFMSALGGGGIYFRRPPIQRPEELAEFVPHGPPLVYFAVAPMMHGAAMWASLIALFAGYTVVVNDESRFDPEHVWDLIVRDGVNILSVVGDAMALPLIRALEQHSARWDLSRLVVFGSGGAIFTEAAQARLKAVLPRIKTTNGMGSSESGVLGARENADRSGAGCIVLDARPDLAVIDDAGRLLTAPGSEGTLARTGYLPIGYYGDPAKTAATFVKAGDRTWCVTGDRARIDEEGNFVVLGRGSQCINTGGEKVYPEEVEEAALRCDAIKDVLVVGAPDERWGQKVVAVVSLLPEQQLDQAAFERVCRERLAGYKVPRSIVIVDEIKRSPAGKADYGWAKRVAAERATA
ncbi:MAG: AMP-binding protein [Steroidobacteraceae bacterium]|nr:AMP-binding protein [Steroidobacteraceae bacterium]MBP7012694.1 AMP-binding protein [Steroidobacteraceae bacterium]